MVVPLRVRYTIRSTTYRDSPSTLFQALEFQKKTDETIAGLARFRINYPSRLSCVQLLVVYLIFQLVDVGLQRLDGLHQLLENRVSCRRIRLRDLDFHLSLDIDV